MSINTSYRASETLVIFATARKFNKIVSPWLAVKNRDNACIVSHKVSF